MWTTCAPCSRASSEICAAGYTVPDVLTSRRTVADRNFGHALTLISIRLQVALHQTTRHRREFCHCSECSAVARHSFHCGSMRCTQPDHGSVRRRNSGHVEGCHAGGRRARCLHVRAGHQRFELPPSDSAHVWPRQRWHRGPGWNEPWPPSLCATHTILRPSQRSCEKQRK